MVRVIAELGSCHMGKLDYIKEAIDRCKDTGIDALKLQLFPDEPKYTDSGNIFLDRHLFLEALEYGIKVGLPVSASVFNKDLYYFLLAQKVQFIKFAFSQKHLWEYPAKDHYPELKKSGFIPEIIVSCDVMSVSKTPKFVTKLYCIPEYPVRYEVAFDGLFPRFDGFSDHTLGLRQTLRAVEAGAKIIEKHVTLPHSDINCPDSFFAVSIEELGELKK